MQKPKPTSGLHHVALYAKNFTGCENFYVNLLGMQIMWRPDDDNLYLTSGNDNLALHRAPENFSPAEHQRLDHIGFFLSERQEVDKWHDYLTANDVTIVAVPKDHRDGTRSFYENNSVADLNFKIIFNNILDSIGMLINNEALREKIFNQLMQAAESADLGAQGIIYQFLIPWNMVNQMAYISGKNGIYDTQNPNTLETLIGLQSSDAKIQNGETLQVRLFVPALLNPDYTKNIIVKNYCNAPTDAWEKLHRAINNCAYEVMLSQSKKPSSPETNSTRFKFSQIGASTKVLEANTVRNTNANENSISSKNNRILNC